MMRLLLKSNFCAFLCFLHLLCWTTEAVERVADGVPMGDYWLRLPAGFAAIVLILCFFGVAGWIAAPVLRDKEGNAS